MPLSPCEVLGKPAGCTVTGVENEVVAAGQNSRLATMACKKFLKSATQFAATGGWKGGWKLAPIDATTARCIWDSDNDGDFNDDWTTASVVLSETPRTPDAHCFCKVTNGPHTNVSWDGQMTYGEAFAAGFMHVFPKGLKKAILQQNIDVNGALTSEAPFDTNSALQKSNIYDGDAAEIDHIIPRVDSKGCLCGDVTPDNAAVISRELNQKMLNISPTYSLERAKMFMEFGVQCENQAVADYRGPDSAVAPTDLDKDQLDETALGVDLDREGATQREAPPPAQPGEHPVVEPADAGGCAASGHAGLGGAVALAMLLGRRRRVNAVR